jgi:hypothetical protein
VPDSHPTFPSPSVSRAQLDVLRELEPAQGARHELIEMVGGPDLDAAQVRTSEHVHAPARIASALTAATKPEAAAR